MPDTGALKVGLAAILGQGSATAAELAILDRTPNPYESSFPMEIVTCRVGDAPPLRLLCKYAAGFEHNAHGHRGGIEHEVAVHRSVLQPLGAQVARVFGSYRDPASRDVWMAAEYLDEAVRVNKAEDTRAIVMAARWAARFHAAAEEYVASTPSPVLLRYDAAYYRGWAERTWRFASARRDEFPWLETLCRRFSGIGEELAAAPQTVIHGEYYPRNVLFVGGIIRPVDWESAAIGVGEIDLAMLVDEWPEEIVRTCEEAYRHERWSGADRPDHHRWLDLARLYIPFRWLGERSEWAYNDWVFERLYQAAGRLALL